MTKRSSANLISILGITLFILMSGFLMWACSDDKSKSNQASEASAAYFRADEARRTIAFDSLCKKYDALGDIDTVRFSFLAEIERRALRGEKLILRDVRIREVYKSKRSTRYDSLYLVVAKVAYGKRKIHVKLEAGTVIFDQIIQVKKAKQIDWPYFQDDADLPPDSRSKKHMLMFRLDSIKYQSGDYGDADYDPVLFGKVIQVWPNYFWRSTAMMRGF